MTWTVWDVLILILALLQVIGLLVVVMAVMRIVKGPVAGVVDRGGRFAAKGIALGEAGKQALDANKVHVQAIFGDVMGIVQNLRTPDVAQSLPINYQTLRRAFSTLMTVRGGLQTLRSFRIRKIAPPGPSGASVAGAVKTAKPVAVRQSVAERLGLVPPAAKHVARLLPYARIVWNVSKQLRR